MHGETMKFLLLSIIWTYFIRYIKNPFFVSDFNQIRSFSTDFLRSPQYKISRNSVQWDPRWSTWSDCRKNRHDEARRWLLLFIWKHLRKNSCWTKQWYK